MFLHAAAATLTPRQKESHLGENSVVHAILTRTQASVRIEALRVLWVDLAQSDVVLVLYPSISFKGAFDHLCKATNLCFRPP